MVPLRTYSPIHSQVLDFVFSWCGYKSIGLGTEVSSGVQGQKLCKGLGDSLPKAESFRHVHSTILSIICSYIATWMLHNFLGKFMPGADSGLQLGGGCVKRVSNDHEVRGPKGGQRGWSSWGGASCPSGERQLAPPHQQTTLEYPGRPIMTPVVLVLLKTRSYRNLCF